MDRYTTGGLKEPFFFPRERKGGGRESRRKILKIFRENTPTGGKMRGPNAEKTEKQREKERGNPKKWEVEREDQLETCTSPLLLTKIAPILGGFIVRPLIIKLISPINMRGAMFCHDWTTNFWFNIVFFGKNFYFFIFLMTMVNGC